MTEAALRSMGADDHLADLGLQRNRVADEANVAPSTVSYHLSGAEFTRGLLKWHRAEMLRVVREHAVHYELGVRGVTGEGPDALRPMLEVVLDHDLQSYLPDDALARGRERLYWVGVALADRETPEGEPDIAEFLRETNTQTQHEYDKTYRAILAKARLVPLDGTTDEAYLKVRRIVNAFLEGVIVHRRLGMKMQPEEIAEGVLSLVRGLTKPAEEAR